MKPLILILDVPTRWSSTYLMLNRFIVYKKPVNRHTRLVDTLLYYSISDSDWVILEHLQQWLRHFAVATYQLSTSNVSTVSMVTLVYEDLRRKILTMVNELPASAPEEVKQGELALGCPP